MGFKEILEKIGEKKKERKRKFKEMEENFRLRKMLEDRQKSANERELERFQNEEREENVKEALDFYRRKREKDIRFNHNPLDVPNITAKTQWEVMKEKNLFTNKKSMFANQPNVIKSNKNLLRNNKKLFAI